MLGTALLQVEVIIDEIVRERDSSPPFLEALGGPKTHTEVPNIVIKQDLSPDFWRQMRNIGCLK